ncbi:MAG: formylmethanofuran dehydrogenase subunit C [Pirellulales bacterium]
MTRGTAMKGIKLQLKQTPPHYARLDMSLFTTDKLLESNELDIANISINVGLQTDHLGNWFSVSITSAESTQPLRIEVEGDLGKVDFLGNRLRDCELHVNGSVGDHLGYAMSSGAVFVKGDVGCHCANQMHGGSITVCGNAGENAGGARVCDRRGMQGGRLIVHGNVGHHAGHRMRRGTIIVHADAGNGLGMRMIAGTIVACGSVGLGMGCGMRRGTILRLGASPDHFNSHENATNNDMERQIPGFTPAEESELSFLPILLQSLRSDLPRSIQTQLPQTPELLPRRGLRYQGDRSILGLGEIISL